MTVVWSRVKSAAVSVSSFPGLARRDAAPMRPSGLPVVNEKSAAHKDVATHIPKASLAPVKLSIDFISLLVVFIFLDEPRPEPGLFAVVVMLYNLTSFPARKSCERRFRNPRVKPRELVYSAQFPSSPQ